jgi:acyl-CoA thioester hydrolase
MLEAQAPSSCSIEVRVRYAECDPMGVLHHAMHPVYLEMGRTELLRQSGYTYKDLEAKGIYLVITRLELRYRSPARYDDLLTIRTTLRRMTHTRIEHDYEITVAGRVVCEANTTLACVDRDARVRPLPDQILALAGDRAQTDS